MEGEGSDQQVVKSAVAAHKLGISKTRLNRLAPIYEQVHGELPRGGRYARLWTPDAIERIRSALLAVEEGRALNVEAALRGFEIPEDTGSRQMPVRFSGESPETLAPLSALEELTEELHALREVVKNQDMLLRDQAHRLERLERLEAASQLPVASAETPKKASLDRMQAHRLKRLETASRLPVTPTEAPKKASLETLDGTNGSSAEDQMDGEDAGQPSTSRNASLGILLIMLLTLSVVVTVISALYMNALLLTVSFVVAVVSLLFGWYYYHYA
jgi:hypothetical protein